MAQCKASIDINGVETACKKEAGHDGDHETWQSELAPGVRIGYVSWTEKKSKK